jgi:hypothetical protein
MGRVNAGRLRRRSDLRYPERVRPCVLWLALLAGCPGTSTTTDTTAETASWEGIAFPDQASGEAVASPDNGPAAEGGTDLPQASDLAPAPDTAAPCTLWSQDCNATCSTGVDHRITCVSSSTTQKCNCVKDGQNVGTCPVNGTLCTACENALSCCPF